MRPGSLDGMLTDVILGLVAAAFLLFVAVAALSWVVGILWCVYCAMRGKSAGRGHAEIEHDSAGLDF